MEEKAKKEREKNMKFFEENLDDWLENVAYKHKHVIIFEQKVQKVFDKFSDALDYAVPRLPSGEFIIQHVIGKDEQIGFLKLAK